MVAHRASAVGLPTAFGMFESTRSWSLTCTGRNDAMTEAVRPAADRRAVRSETPWLTSNVSVHMASKQWRIAIHDFTEVGAPEHVASTVREVRAHLSNLLTSSGYLITLDKPDLVYGLLGSPSAEGGEVTKLEVDVRSDAEPVSEGTHVIGEGWDNAYNVAEGHVRYLGEYIERQNAEAEGSGSPHAFAAPATGDSFGTMVKMRGGEYRLVSIPTNRQVPSSCSRY